MIATSATTQRLELVELIAPKAFAAYTSHARGMTEAETRSFDRALEIARRIEAAGWRKVA